MRTRLLSSFSISAVLAATLAASAGHAGEPCCAVKSIDAKARTVTVVDTKTECTYRFSVNDEKDLRGLKAGAAIDLDLKGLAPVSGPPRKPGASVAAASSNTTSCGSNVGRNENTKPGSKCYVKTEDKGWVQVPCK